MVEGWRKDRSEDRSDGGIGRDCSGRLVRRVLFNQDTEAGAGAGDPALHRAQAQAERGGDLLIGVFQDGAQSQDFPLIFAQQRHAPVNAGGELPEFRVERRIGSGADTGVPQRER